MKKNFWLVWTIVLCLSFGYAQNVTSIQTFKPLQSQGEFPSFLNEVLAASPKDNIYNVFLKNLISEGKILYGTELNQYIDHIADQLLAQNPDLREELDIYILEVPEVNAYSLKNGTILINMGMLAQVTNEAELAFVIAHEIAHYSEQHGTLGQKNKSKNKDFVTDYLQTHQYSRDQEFAADRVGLTQYFKNSSYSFDVLDGIFDVLLFANLPFDEIPFDKSEVETEFYSFPENYFLKTVATISDRSTVVDTFLTHPNIEKRRAAVKALSQSFSNENRKKFVQPEAEFYRIRDLARFSCIEYYLIRHQYDRAIYNIHVLQQQFPDNEYLESAMVSAFYGASKHKSEGSISSTYKSYKKVEGEMQQVNYLMSKMNRLEYSLLALRKAWAAREKHPDDPYLNSITKELIQDIFVTQKKTYVDFCDYPQGTKLEDIHEEEAASNTGESKYDRIKQQTTTGKVLPEAKFKTANYMLVDIHQDSLFKAWVNDAIINSDAIDLLENLSEKHIGDEKQLLIAEPIYQIYDNDSQLQFSKSKKHALRLQNIIAHSTKKMGVEPNTCNVKPGSQLDTKTYNELSRIRLLCDDINNCEGFGMRYHSAKYIDDLIPSVGNKMCYVYVSANPYSWFTINKLCLMLYSVACPYTIPITLANCCFMKYDTNVSFCILDISTSQIEKVTTLSKAAPISRAYVDGFVYSQLENYIKGKK